MRLPAPDAEEMPLTYTMGPFAFESEIAFPELLAQAPAGLHPVRIRRVESLPETLPGGLQIDEYCSATVQEYLLFIPDVARFHVRAGDEVRFRPEPGAQERDIRLYLLGSIFGVLCHQNGFLPLHASAVESDGQVTSFVAESGVGKSTLAAFLGRQGFPVVADDICLLQPEANGSLRVVPVGGWLKLWQRSLDVLGEPGIEDHRVISSEDKFRIYLPPADTASRERGLRLSRIVFLERPSDATAVGEPALFPLAAPTAVARLMDATYNAYLLHRLGLQQRLFQQCAQAVQGASVFRLVAPWGWESMPKVIALLEVELRGAGARTI